MREVLDLVTPSVLIHGHYHSAYEHRSAESWGRLKTFGLNCNESKGWGVTLRDAGGGLPFEWVGIDDHLGRPLLAGCRATSN